MLNPQLNKCKTLVRSTLTEQDKYQRSTETPYHFGTTSQIFSTNISRVC